VVPGFSSQFLLPAEADRLARDCYLEAHRRAIEGRPPLKY